MSGAPSNQRRQSAVFQGGSADAVMAEVRGVPSLPSHLTDMASDNHHEEQSSPSLSKKSTKSKVASLPTPRATANKSTNDSDASAGAVSARKLPTPRMTPRSKTTGEVNSDSPGPAGEPAAADRTLSTGTLKAEAGKPKAPPIDKAPRTLPPSLSKGAKQIEEVEDDDEGDFPEYVAPTRKTRQLTDSQIDAAMKSTFSIKEKTPWDLLLAAIRSSDRVSMIALIKEGGVTVNFADKEKWTPLFHAVNMEVPSACTTLLELGADPNMVDANRKIPLSYACRSGLEQCVEVLAPKSNCDQEHQDESTPLTIAAEKGFVKIVAHLMQNGAKVDKPGQRNETALMKAAGAGKLAVVKLLLRHPKLNVNAVDSNGWTAMHHAAGSMVESEGHEPILRLLKEKGGDLDAKDQASMTPLHFAARRGKEQATKALHELGANLECKDLMECTPLMAAVVEGHLKNVEFLLSVGANINAVDKYGTPTLIMAVINGQVKIVRYLLKMDDLNVHVTDKLKKTALHYAVIAEDSELAFLLIKAGLDLSTKDEFGETARVIAKQKDMRELLDNEKRFKERMKKDEAMRKQEEQEALDDEEESEEEDH